MIPSNFCKLNISLHENYQRLCEKQDTFEDDLESFPLGLEYVMTNYESKIIVNKFLDDFYLPLNMRKLIKDNWWVFLYHLISSHLS